MKPWIRKLEGTGLFLAFTFGQAPGTPASEPIPFQFLTVEKDHEPGCIPNPWLEQVLSSFTLFLAHSSGHVGTVCPHLCCPFLFLPLVCVLIPHLSWLLMALLPPSLSSTPIPVPQGISSSLSLVMTSILPVCSGYQFSLATVRALDGKPPHLLVTEVRPMGSVACFPSLCEAHGFCGMLPQSL